MLGYNGETCAEAIRSSLGTDEIATFEELYQRVRMRGAWKDETIWQHLMSRVVNLVPARYHWKKSDPFLYLHGDGRYELFSSSKHP